jgi:hypothetical protein
MTGKQLFKASGLSGEYDTAIPQQVFNKISDALGFNPLGHFVWWYPDRGDEEYVMGGKLLPVKTMYDLAIKKRKLILIEEKYALVNHLVTDVDRDIVLASELEQMSQEKAFYG